MTREELLKYCDRNPYTVTLRSGETVVAQIHDFDPDFTLMPPVPGLSTRTPNRGWLHEHIVRADDVTRVEAVEGMKYFTRADLLLRFGTPVMDGNMNLEPVVRGIPLSQIPQGGLKESPIDGIPQSMLWRCPEHEDLIAAIGSDPDDKWVLVGTCEHARPPST